MATTQNNQALVQTLVGVFREYGFEGASLSILSKKTGLGRSSLYHHFPKGKEDMASAALEWVLLQFHQQVCEPLCDQSLSPEDRLQQASLGLSEFYSDGDRSCLINIFSVGHAASLFQDRLSESVSGLAQLFTQLAIDAGLSADAAQLRGQHAVMLIQGALVMSRASQSQVPFLAALARLPSELLVH